MNAGDEFLATIRVYYTGQTTCGGGRGFEDVENAVHVFDEADFESMELLKPELPDIVGARVRVFPYRKSGNMNSFIAMLASDGRWVTTWAEEFRSLSKASLVEMDWEPLP